MISLLTVWIFISLIIWIVAIEKLLDNWDNYIEQGLSAIKIYHLILALLTLPVTLLVIILFPILALMALIEHIFFKYINVPITNLWRKK